MHSWVYLAAVCLVKSSPPDATLTNHKHHHRHHGGPGLLVESASSLPAIAEQEQQSRRAKVDNSQPAAPPAAPPPGFVYSSFHTLLPAPVPDVAAAARNASREAAAAAAAKDAALTLTLTRLLAQLTQAQKTQQQQIQQMNEQVMANRVLLLRNTKLESALIQEHQARVVAETQLHKLQTDEKRESIAQQEMEQAKRNAQHKADLDKQTHTEEVRKKRAEDEEKSKAKVIRENSCYDKCKNDECSKVFDESVEGYSDCVANCSKKCYII